MNNNNTSNPDNWVVEKMCTDKGEYALSVEKQKTHWGCEQKRESWKWNVSYHGTITSQGSGNSVLEAQQAALANVPQQHS